MDVALRQWYMKRLDDLRMKKEMDLMLLVLNVFLNEGVSSSRAFLKCFHVVFLTLATSNYSFPIQYHMNQLPQSFNNVTIGEATFKACLDSHRYSRLPHSFRVNQLPLHISQIWLWLLFKPKIRGRLHPIVLALISPITPNTVGYAWMQHVCALVCGLCQWWKPANTPTFVQLPNSRETA